MHAMHTSTLLSKLHASGQGFGTFLSGVSMCKALPHAVLRHAELGMTLGRPPLHQGTAMSNCLTYDQAC